MEIPPDQGQSAPGLFTDCEWRRVSAALPLTPRQSHVLQAVFAGQSDRAIANDLAISLPTVRTHMRALFRAFGVSDRTNMVIATARIALDRPALERRNDFDRRLTSPKIESPLPDAAAAMLAPPQP